MEPSSTMSVLRRAFDLVVLDLGGVQSPHKHYFAPRPPLWGPRRSRVGGFWLVALPASV